MVRRPAGTHARQAERAAHQGHRRPGPRRARAGQRPHGDDPAVLRDQGLGLEGKDQPRLSAAREDASGRPPAAWPLIAGIAAAKLALHLAVNATTPYGFHRDELLYLAMGRNLRPWRMDF